VMIGWVFFRADSLTHAKTFLASMLGAGPAGGVEHTVARYLDRPVQLALVAGVILSIPIAQPLARWLSRRGPVIDGTAQLFAMCSVLALFLLGAMQMAADTYNPFIYFRF